ncbi:unnamed protein product, partial [Polarella glacialis]
ACICPSLFARQHVGLSLCQWQRLGNRRRQRLVGRRHHRRPDGDDHLWLTKGGSGNLQRCAGSGCRLLQRDSGAAVQ